MPKTIERPESRRRTRGWAVVALLAGTFAAQSPASAEDPKPAATVEREFTLGLVQKGLKVGMTQADVAAALGSPNLVTRTASGRESWVYDKISSETRLKSSGGSGALAGAAAPGTVAVLGAVSGSWKDERTVTSQKTLTVVIRFDAWGAVESFTYHSSRF